MEASAAVLVLDAIVMLDDVVEGDMVAEVHDLVISAVGRAAGVLEVRAADPDPVGPSPSAGVLASRLDDAVACGMVGLDCGS